MSDYLHHVAIRMLDDPSAAVAMILPGAQFVFPTHIGQSLNEHPAPLEDLSQPKKEISHNNDPVIINQVSETLHNKLAHPAPITPYYVRSPLQPNVDPPKEAEAEKTGKYLEPLPQKAVPDEAHQPIAAQPAELHTIEHRRESEILKMDKVLQVHSKEVLTQHVILDRDTVQQTHILPPAAPLLQKIPTVNKLTIGKITVEIVKPVQPQLKTKERSVTRIVSAMPKDSPGTSKLSYGLRQL